MENPKTPQEAASFRSITKIEGVSTREKVLAKTFRLYFLLITTM
jgi:hypothetical protein